MIRVLKKLKYTVELQRKARISNKAQTYKVTRLRSKKQASAVRDIVKLVLIILWITGIVLAKGFWSTLLAVVVAPWAWYISIEYVMLLNGWL